MARYKVKILRISECRWTGSEQVSTQTGGNMVFPGQKNINKSKVLRLNARRQDPIKINDIDFEDTNSFMYLGAIVNNLGGA